LRKDHLHTLRTVKIF